MKLLFSVSHFCSYFYEIFHYCFRTFLLLHAIVLLLPDRFRNSDHCIDFIVVADTDAGCRCCVFPSIDIALLFFFSGNKWFLKLYLVPLLDVSEAFLM